MEAHPKIWTYDEFSLEVPSGLLDGVMNFFEFATLDGKSVHFLPPTSERFVIQMHIFL